MQVINDGKINSISFEIKKPVKGQARTPEEELINQFVERLNFSRVGKYKPLSFIAIRKKLKDSQVTTRDQLYWFYRECDTSKIGFSKYFWWSLKVKK